MTVRIREMLQSRKQLLVDVSHELRSPLTRMKVALEFLPESSAKKSLSEDIREMETMVSEILETERLNSEFGQLQLQPTEVEGIVREVIADFKQTAPNIRFENRAGNVILSLDRQRIKTVLKNIIDNAGKYSHDAGAPVRLVLEHKDPYVVLHVTDSGEGIPPEDLQHIFEPFYRVDKSRARNTGGYGLGLSLCKTIMEAHKGNIEVESTVGQGTEVHLFFPVA